jgi:adenylate cyclase
MQGELPGLNEQWRSRINGTLGLGIGINTGPALVGNTGCPRKFKYGPLGHAVNLASRTEGATKQLCVPILITGSTHAQLAGGFATRRLCRVRVVGIDGAVDLYELHAARIEPEWQSRRDAYESALTLYESSRWTEACRTLYPMLAAQEGRYDHPTLTLIGRAIECLKSNPPQFDPVINLTDK